MRPDKFSMAKSWINDERSTPEEAKATWESMSKEFDENRKAMLMASAESDRIKDMMNEKFGPGTMKYGSEIPQPEIKTPQAIFEFGQRNPAAEGGAAKQLLAQPSADGSRPGYATSTVKKGKFIYPVTNQHGTVYSDIKPKSSAAEIGSGKFSIAERNRITKIKYPEYTSYLDLLKKEPAKAKNVMASLQYASKSGSKITKKNFLTPLTEIQQNKILEEFPDADFSKGKFGFNTKTDQTKFVQVKKYIDRGYKPRFKSLPLKVQNQIKEKFSEIKNWDFKKFKYGIPQTFKASENRKIAMRIKNFVADPKPFMFAFSFDRPGAWMTQQMYRAWEHGNTDYEPKYNKNNKVIGMYEKGKLYYANENVAPSKKFKLINSHPEFNKVQKFVDVAAEAKLPLKDLGGYKNTKALMALFPEGFESVKFSDLTNYLYKEQGADVTRNAIEKHHLKNLADMGAPVESKNLQLLRQDLNTLGNTITQQIKEGDFSRVGDLEKAGVKITVDGKTYGKGFQDPRRQLNRIIGDVTQKVSSLDEKQFKEMIKAVGCPVKGKAEGGRIGFAEGADCFNKGQKIINSGFKGASSASMRNGAKLLNSLYRGGRNVMKFGIVPEAIFVGGETLLRSLGDQSLDEGFKSSLGFYTDWTGLTDFKADARISQNMRNMGVDAAMNLERLAKFNDATDKVNKLKQMKESNLAINDESLTGLTDQEVAANADKNIAKAQEYLDKNFLKESEKLYFSQQQDEATDIAGTKSPFKKFLGDARNKTENMSYEEDFSGMQSDMFNIDPMSAKAKRDRVKNLPPQSPLTGSKGEQDFLNLSQLPMGPRMGSEIDVLAKAMNENFKAQGLDQRVDSQYLKAMQDYKQNYKDMTMEEMLAIGIPAEAIYGFNIAEPIKQKPVYDFSEGGITGLRSKYEYKK